MNWDFLLHPVAGYALTGAGLLACGYLFLTAKREISKSARNSREKQKALEARIRTLEETAGGLARRLEEIADLPEPFVSLPAAGGINISKRTQALRMHRRGEPPERIAASLSLPQQEVELLLKIESLAADKA